MECGIYQEPHKLSFFSSGFRNIVNKSTDIYVFSETKIKRSKITNAQCSIIWTLNTSKAFYQLSQNQISYQQISDDTYGLKWKNM